MLSKSDLDRLSKRYFDSKTVAARRILELIAHIESLSQKHAALVEEVKAWREWGEADWRADDGEKHRVHEVYCRAVLTNARAHTDSISALERSEG